MNIENNHKENYLRHLNFLTPYQEIWNKEVLNNYPDSIQWYSEEWIEYLEHLSDEKLHQIDAHIDYSYLQNSSMKNLCEELIRLVQIPLENISKRELPIKAFNKIKDKKEYEIGMIVSFIEKIFHEKKFSKVLDFGSGVGNLARILSDYYDIKTTCLEKDPYLISQGKKYLERHAGAVAQKNIHFQEFSLEKWNNESKLHIEKDAFILGLHSCGNLSQRILETSTFARPKFILNFGCCYLKMNTDTDLNVSSFAKKNSHTISKAGLTLATRFRVGFDFKEYELKKRVKNYRYALHLFFYHELGLKDFLSVGDSKPRDYEQDFAFYAQKKIQKTQAALTITPEKLNLFYNDKENQKKIRQMFLADIIRNHFGRAVENLILLDRSIFLEEQGYQVTLSTFFDELQSPRNRGIFAERI